jgi:hypothetical protein
MTQFRPARPGSPIPENMGAVADEYAQTRQFRLAMEKIVEPVQERESELRQHMIKNLEKSRGAGKDTGAAGRLYRVQIKDKETPKVADWPTFWAFIKRTGRFDLLQKRLSDKAVMDMVEADEMPDGIETILVPDVSVTKV